MTITNEKTEHRVVSPAEWLEARRGLLIKEKELTRERERLTKMRMDLPWVRVEKEYVFEGPQGEQTLADLFEGRNQLIVYHFMLAPGWEEGCLGCTFVADHFDSVNLHLPHLGVSFVAASLAPLPEIEAYRKRMGWQFKWVSSGGSDFNYDFGVSFRQEDLDRGPVMYNYTVQTLTGDEQPGASVFYRNEDGEIYHTYSTYERGLEDMIGTYDWLDRTPLGRQETGPMSRIERHDVYGVK